ncbi:5-azacytidine-induced protein 2 isoform X2 [Ascaphus truei]
MDATVDDDICILTHEIADCMQRDREIPYSASSGEESVASHFALVTAYEDIKKRLKETEKENYSLKKRLRLMEEMLHGARGEETSMVGREQVNKAFSVYRKICIERDSLKNKLDVMEKERLESAKTQNEQLQSKEVELLQLKTELETQQVMKSLSNTLTDWEIEKLNSELKMRSVEQELKLLQEECRSLRGELQRTKDTALEKSLSCKEHHQGDETESDSSVRQAYWELKKEMSNLHLVTEVQAEVLRKLKATVTATKKALRSGPVQCEEDLEKNCSRLLLTSTGATYEKVPFLLPNKHKLSSIPAPQLQEDENAFYEKTDLTRWTSERPIPVGGTDSEENDSYKRTSFEENSWEMPSPPKPSETQFWETRNSSSSNYPVLFVNQYDSQNYLYKS